MLQFTRGELFVIGFMLFAVFSVPLWTRAGAAVGRFFRQG